MIATQHDVSDGLLCLRLAQGRRSLLICMSRDSASIVSIFAVEDTSSEGLCWCKWTDERTEHFWKRRLQILWPFPKCTANQGMIGHRNLFSMLQPRTLRLGLVQWCRQRRAGNYPASSSESFSYSVWRSLPKGLIIGSPTGSSISSSHTGISQDFLLWERFGKMTILLTSIALMEQTVISRDRVLSPRWCGNVGVTHRTPSAYGERPPYRLTGKASLYCQVNHTYISSQTRRTSFCLWRSRLHTQCRVSLGFSLFLSPQKQKQNQKQNKEKIPQFIYSFSCAWMLWFFCSCKHYYHNLKKVMCPNTDGQEKLFPRAEVCGLPYSDSP